MPQVLVDASPVALTCWTFGFVVGLTLLALAIGFIAERVFRDYRVFAVSLAKHQLRFELIGNLVFIAVTTAALTLVLQAKRVRFGEEGWIRGILTFFAILVGFQIYYWFLHRLMHTKALIQIHAWHHRSHVTTPLSGQSMGFLEALGWMLGYAGLPLAFSLLVPISFWGWAGYLAFNILGNIVGHANVEMTAKMGVTRTTALIGNPFVYHALHHARWRGHYAFQAAFMDRVFGTEFADWPALYARVSSGQPLKSLKERGDDAQAEAFGNRVHSSR